MKNKLNFKLKSPISTALSFSLFFQPFLVPLAHAQSTQTPSTAHPISYDTNGNMTQDENGNTYEYDAENKLISFVKGDGSLKTEYNYYADGSRKSKQITLKENGKPKPLNPIHFYYDHAKNKNVVNETQLFNGKTVTSSYLIANDTRYARYLSNDASGAKYYVKNHKDTTMMVNEKGSNPTSHSYTPYGVERTAKATNTIIADEIKFSIVSNPFLYSSQYTDAESGLQYLRARYYKADHMRFISRDTNSKPRNKYAYANGNPIMEDDPSGMMADWIKDLFTPKSLASMGAGIAAGVILGVFTGGAGFAATIAAGVVEGAVGATAQVGVSRLWDKESFFTTDTLKEIGINTAVAGVLAGAGGLAAGKIAGSERIGAKPLFGEKTAAHIDDLASKKPSVSAKNKADTAPHPASRRAPTTSREVPASHGGAGTTRGSARGQESGASASTGITPDDEDYFMVPRPPAPRRRSTTVDPDLVEAGCGFLGCILQAFLGGG